MAASQPAATPRWRHLFPRQPGINIAVRPRGKVALAALAWRPPSPRLMKAPPLAGSLRLWESPNEESRKRRLHLELKKAMSSMDTAAIEQAIRGAVEQGIVRDDQVLGLARKRLKHAEVQSNELDCMARTRVLLGDDFEHSYNSKPGTGVCHGEVDTDSKVAQQMMSLRVDRLNATRQQYANRSYVSAAVDEDAGRSCAERSLRKRQKQLMEVVFQVAQVMKWEQVVRTRKQRRDGEHRAACVLQYYGKQRLQAKLCKRNEEFQPLMRAVTPFAQRYHQWYVWRSANVISGFLTAVSTYGGSQLHHELHAKFRNYAKLVQLVQKTWRAYCDRKAFRLGLLGLLWDRIAHARQSEFRDINGECSHLFKDSSRRVAQSKNSQAQNENKLEAQMVKLSKLQSGAVTGKISKEESAARHGELLDRCLWMKRFISRDAAWSRQQKAYAFHKKKMLHKYYGQLLRMYHRGEDESGGVVRESYATRAQCPGALAVPADIALMREVLHGRTELEFDLHQSAPASYGAPFLMLSRLVDKREVVALVQQAVSLAMSVTDRRTSELHLATAVSRRAARFLRGRTKSPRAVRPPWEAKEGSSPQVQH